jgi:RimJ/RimL family protein N-acetyltransferase
VGDAVVRGFREDDRDELRALFRRAGEGSPTSSLWGHEPSEADTYLGVYMDLVPEHLSVAEIDGALVGYLTGCPDPSRVPSDTKRILRAIRTHRLYLKRAPLAFFGRAAVDSLGALVRRQGLAGDFADERWPAHLHIDLVREARGTGVAYRLMERWQGQLVEMGSPGCHLQTMVENTRAVAFFERCGFRRHGRTPVIPGARTDAGGKVHEQAMVWSTELGRSQEST